MSDRKGATFGAIRQLGEGSMVGTGFTWTRAKGINGASSEVFDGAIAAAHRPANSAVAFLTKVEFRSDSVTNAVSGIILVGAISQLGNDSMAIKIIATAAVLIASINVFGGFTVTQRMLTMFRKG